MFTATVGLRSFSLPDDTEYSIGAFSDSTGANTDNGSLCGKNS